MMIDDEKKFEALLRYYRERALGAACNRTRLRDNVDAIIILCRDEITRLSGRIQRLESEERGGDA